MFLGALPLTPDRGEQIFSVSQLNSQARQLLERTFGSVQVAGEISNFKKDRSGHCYLCLKDANAVLSAALFRREAQATPFNLDNGLQVVATGQLTIYGPTGRYQLIIKRLTLQGAGAMQAAFVALRAKLLAEGLFAAERKRPLPKLVRRVAVITSLQGAVLRDIVHVCRRRQPNAQIIVVPTRVQGPDSGAPLEAAVRLVDHWAQDLGIDVAILARGGGSLEDLWGFNAEGLARAIAGCRIPVVAAVGHETDYSICDFVADVRAPTPSAAAAAVFADHGELHAQLRQLAARCKQALKRELRQLRLRLREQAAALGDGRRALWPHLQRHGTLQARLEACRGPLVTGRRQALQRLDMRVTRAHPRVRLVAIAAQQRAATARTAQAMAQALQRRRMRLQEVGGRLVALGPLAVLQRGYAIVLDASGNAVRRPEQVLPGAAVAIRLAKGAIRARIEA